MRDYLEVAEKCEPILHTIVCLTREAYAATVDYSVSHCSSPTAKFLSKKKFSTKASDERKVVTFKIRNSKLNNLFPRINFPLK